jgi:hypothetical protein
MGWGFKPPNDTTVDQRQSVDDPIALLKCGCEPYDNPRFDAMGEYISPVLARFA